MTEPIVGGDGIQARNARRIRRQLQVLETATLNLLELIGLFLAGEDTINWLEVDRELEAQRAIVQLCRDIAKQVLQETGAIECPE